MLGNSCRLCNGLFGKRVLKRMHICICMSFPGGSGQTRMTPFHYSCWESKDRGTWQAICNKFTPVSWLKRDIYHKFLLREVDLQQEGVSFGCTAKWSIYTYTCILSHCPALRSHGLKQASCPATTAKPVCPTAWASCNKRDKEWAQVLQPELCPHSPQQRKQQRPSAARK